MNVVDSFFVLSSVLALVGGLYQVWLVTDAYAQLRSVRFAPARDRPLFRLIARQAIGNTVAFLVVFIANLVTNGSSIIWPPEGRPAVVGIAVRVTVFLMLVIITTNAIVSQRLQSHTITARRRRE